MEGGLRSPAATAASTAVWQSVRLGRPPPGSPLRRSSRSAQPPLPPRGRPQARQSSAVGRRHPPPASRRHHHPRAHHPPPAPCPPRALPVTATAHRQGGSVGCSGVGATDRGGRENYYSKQIHAYLYTYVEVVYRGCTANVLYRTSSVPLVFAVQFGQALNNFSEIYPHHSHDGSARAWCSA